MNQTQAMTRTETMLLNVGPTHPSTHGVLRVLVELDGELISAPTRTSVTSTAASRRCASTAPITSACP